MPPRVLCEVAMTNTFRLCFIYVHFSFMLLNFLGSKPHLQHLSRNTSNDAIGGTRLRHHSASSYHRSTPDGYTFQYCDISPCPHIIFDYHRCIILWQFLIGIHDILANDIYTMVTSDDCGMRTEYHFLAYCQGGFRTIEYAPFRNAGIIPYTHIPKPFEVRTRRTKIHMLSAMTHRALIKISQNLIIKIGRKKA